jgi:hypothetical protein
MKFRLVLTFAASNPINRCCLAWKANIDQPLYFISRKLPKITQHQIKSPKAQQIHATPNQITQHRIKPPRVHNKITQRPLKPPNVHNKITQRPLKPPNVHNKIAQRPIKPHNVHNKITQRPLKISNVQKTTQHPIKSPNIQQNHPMCITKSLYIHPSKPPNGRQNHPTSIKSNKCKTKSPKLAAVAQQKSGENAKLN